MNQLAAPTLVVDDPARLQLYPDVAAILAGGAPVSLGTIIPDDFVQAYALNTTGGITWQLGRRAALDVDYVHASGTHQAGFVDRNLPAAGAISPANPRPVAGITQAWMLENYTRSVQRDQLRQLQPGHGDPQHQFRSIPSTAQRARGPADSVGAPLHLLITRLRPLATRESSCAPAAFFSAKKIVESAVAGFRRPTVRVKGRTHLYTAQ